MGSEVSKLLDHLKGSRDAWRPTITLFPEVDLRQLSRDLNLETKGEQAASSFQGNLDDKGLDLVEREILDDLSRRARISTEQYAAELEGYDGRMRAAAIGQGAFVMVKAAAAEGLANFQAQAEEDRLKLEAEAARTQRVCEQFHSFSKQHQLEKSAPYVPHANKLLTDWLVIAIIFILETLLNGMFFAAGSYAGLVGGFSEALALSALNVAIAMLTGLVAIRWLRHRAMIAKLLAGFLLLLCVVAAPGLNLLIAHYREAFVAASGEAVHFRDVLGSLISAPFVLNEVRSWVLGALGLVFFGLAAWKFHGLVDPYPNYGRLARLKREALDQFIGMRSNCINVLTEHRNAAVDEMKEVVQAVEGKRHEYEQARRGRERLHQAFVDHLAAFDAAAETLVLIYLNAAERGEGHVRLSLGLRAPDLDPPYVGDDSKGHQKAIDTMSEYIDQLLHEYSQAVHSLPTVDLNAGTMNAATP